MSEQVDILLATYQGENYLEELLESILIQTHSNLHLWIRDDGSTDRTIDILQKWINIYPQKITLVPSQKHVGAKGNFSELMQQSRAPYVMFADQDDKWLSNKVEISLDHMKAMERRYGFHLPLLVHTDLKVVNQTLEEIASSFWSYTGLNPNKTSLNRLLVQNVLTGCTLLLNRALVDKAQRIPDKAIMHDWWIALVAACFGHIYFISQATILYRQHNHNDIGAKSHHFLTFFKQSEKEKKKKKECENQTYEQVFCLLELYQTMLPLEKQQILKAYIEMKHLSYLKQKHRMIKYRFFKQGFLRNMKNLLTKNF